MLSIQECLDNIKSAVFGRDVRQSIHDGIKGIDDESKADMKKKQEKIDTYTDKMDLLNDKYEEQIKNLTLNSPSDAEIVDSRRTKDNTVFSTLKERLDEDKNSIWIQKQLTSVATLDETPDQLGLLRIDIPANCVLDKDTLSITPVYKNGDGDALTGSAFTKIEKGEKLEFTIEKVYFDSLCYDVLEDQGVQGGSIGTLEFPVGINVKVSYLSATETKVNQFVGKPEELNTAAKSDLVSAVNELNINLLEKVFPVGAIYMSVNSTDPEILFGGRWERWGNGRVPVGVSEGETEFATTEKKNGEKVHTISEAEMPVHKHVMEYSILPNRAETGNINGSNGSYYVTGYNAVSTATAGNGAAHNNLQPYITCYMWVRRQ